jgi:hypothetical protein
LVRSRVGSVVSVVVEFVACVGELDDMVIDESEEVIDEVSDVEVEGASTIFCFSFCCCDCLFLFVHNERITTQSQSNVNVTMCRMYNSIHKNKNRTKKKKIERIEEIAMRGLENKKINKF